MGTTEVIHAQVPVIQIFQMKQRMIDLTNECVNHSFVAVQIIVSIWVAKFELDYMCSSVVAAYSSPFAAIFSHSGREPSRWIYQTLFEREKRFPLKVYAPNMIMIKMIKGRNSGYCF